MNVAKTQKERKAKAKRKPPTHGSRHRPKYNLLVITDKNLMKHSQVFLMAELIISTWTPKPHMKTLLLVALGSHQETKPFSKCKVTILTYFQAMDLWTLLWPCKEHLNSSHKTHRNKTGNQITIRYNSRKFQDQTLLTKIWVVVVQRSRKKIPCFRIPWRYQKKS